MVDQLRRALITVVYRPFCICFSEHKFTAARLVHLQFHHWTTLLLKCHLHLSPILLHGSQLRQPVHPKYHVVTRDIQDSEIPFSFLTHDHSRSLHTVSLSIFCLFANLHHILILLFPILMLTILSLMSILALRKAIISIPIFRSQ